MIAGLSGVLIAKDFGHIVLDVNGVHYSILMSANAVAQAPSVGEKVSIHCHMNVREDVIQLFGFFDKKEQHVFTTLISVNGVGPKLAITILSGSTVEQFREAILARDSKTLQGIPGVGKKTSERLVLELKDKLVSTDEDMMSESPHRLQRYRDVVIALENLGYKKKAADIAVKALVEEQLAQQSSATDASSDLSPETLLRDALVRLNNPMEKRRVQL